MHFYTFLSEIIDDYKLCMVLECGSTDFATYLKRNKLEVYEIWFFWTKMLLAVKVIHDHGEQI